MKKKYSTHTSSLALHASLHLLKCLGAVKTKAMFGGYGLFLNDIFFGFFTNGKIHLKAGEQTKSTFESLGIPPHSYFKRSYWVNTNYYPVPDEWLNNLSELKKHAMLAITEAQKTMETKPHKNKTNDRIKDLPNLKWSTENLLRKVNINTADQLKANGAIDTFVSLVEISPKEIDIKMLFMLEGAITGQHWSVLSMEKRNELVSALPDHIPCNYELEEV